MCIKISIIILSFNSGEMLYHTIDSVLAQNIEGLEIIIADDGSKNFEIDRVRDYINEHLEVHKGCFQILVNTTNLGTVRNINRAIKESHGKYIKIIAGDDIYPTTDICSTQVEFLENNPDKFGVIGLLQECNQNLQLIVDKHIDDLNDGFIRMFELPRNKALKEYLKDQDMIFVTQATCFKRTFFSEYCYFDERFRLIEDMPMGAYLLMNNVPFSTINKICVCHRKFVGVSASQEVFSGSRVAYYSDLVNCYKYIYVPNSKGIGKLKAFERQRSNQFRLEICEMKNKKKKTRVKYLIIALKYLDSLFFYTCMMPRKTIDKILNVIKK